MTTGTKPHRTTVESTTSDAAAFLADALGQKLVAFAVGVEPKTVGRWATGESEPREQSEQRLRAVLYIVRLLSEVESSHTIRAWFAGLNPLLGEESPAAVIREGGLKDAVSAAKAFASDG